MLADRSYMQEPAGRPGLSGTVKLMILLGVAFILKWIDETYLDAGVVRWLALDQHSFLHGCVWQLFTFQFIHAGPVHLAFNLLALYCFGRPLEMAYGSRYMTLFFFLTGMVGGMVHVVAGWLMPDIWGGPVVGASAGTSGLLAAFCLMEPNGLILIYFLPVRARYVLWLSFGLSLVFMLFPMGSHVAHTAHLGGLVAGIYFLRRGLPGAGWLSGFSWGRRRGASPPLSAPAWAAEPAAPRPPSRGDFISREIDPILDKISTHGIHSLTPEERRILESARSRMNRR
jgi:membrane associated rhomboid family serine protease